MRRQKRSFTRNQRAKLRPEVVLPKLEAGPSTNRSVVRTAYHGSASLGLDDSFEEEPDDVEDREDDGGDEDATEQQIRSTQHPLGRCVICSTGLEVEEKSRIVRLAKDLGAFFTGDYTTTVTHLIARSRDSEKYRVAARLPKVKIMAPEWIFAVHEAWMLGRDKADYYLALESQHRLPAFVKCKISTTGLDPARLSGVQLEISTRGGVYSPTLDKSCTHLIVEKKSGDKLKAALQWSQGVSQPCKTPIPVWTEWLLDSIKRGCAQNENEYSVLKARPERELLDDSMSMTQVQPEDRLPAPADLAHDKQDPAERIQLKKRSTRNLTERTASAIGLEGALFQSTSDTVSKDADEEVINALAKRRQESILASTEIAGTVKGKSFRLRHFDDDVAKRLRGAIEEAGGVVIEDEFACQFVVVPVNSVREELEELPKGTQYVTQHFISRAIATSDIVTSRAHILSQPLGRHGIDLDKILPHHIISHTGFSREVDRHQLKRLCALLGAEATDTFSQKNTHLVCSRDLRASSIKIEAALNAVKVVVREAWLEQCARESRLVPIEPYVLDKASFDEMRLKDITNVDLDQAPDRLERTDSNASKIAKLRAERDRREQDRRVSRLKRGASDAESSTIISLSNTKMPSTDGEGLRSLSIDSFSSFGQLRADSRDSISASTENMSAWRRSAGGVQVEYEDLPSAMKAQEGLKKGILPSAELLEQIAYESNNQKRRLADHVIEVPDEEAKGARRRSGRKIEV